jgi:RecB family exonuclease
MALKIEASAKPPVKGFTAWSFSRYNAYLKCPLAAKLSNIDKIPQPESSAMLRGSGIHAMAAEYIMGGERSHQLPADLRLFSGLFEELRAGHPETVLVEDSWAFRDDWSVTTWDDWTGCRVRIKVDVAQLEGDTVNIIDWKTGKFSPQWNVSEYELQLELYVLGAMIMFGESVPNLKVSPRLVYLDHGLVYPEEPKVWTMEHLPALRNLWERRATPLMNDTIFAPNPGRACSWCAYGKSKPQPSGGHCEHG